jgi:hypothetical protein
MNALDGTPVEETVTQAEQALRSWGDLTRDQAEQLLDGWKHAAELSRQEREAVLDRFPSGAALLARFDGGRRS